MTQSKSIDIQEYMLSQVRSAKIHFERALECKHTEFDDLYPYMAEQPQFFWYKRYVAWSELLTLVKISTELDIKWSSLFTAKQVDYIIGRVLHGHVLDFWFETEEALSNHSEE